MSPVSDSRQSVPAHGPGASDRPGAVQSGMVFTRITRIGGRILVASLLPASVLLHGCAQSRGVADAPPPDTTTTSAITTTTTARPRDAAISISRSGDDAAWFIVESDGSLRASLGERIGVTPSPPLVRTLTAMEWDELWRESLAAQAEVQEGPAAGGTGPVRAEFRSGGRVVWGEGVQPGPGVEALWARLRTLSWADGR